MKNLRATAVLGLILGSVPLAVQPLPIAAQGSGVYSAAQAEQGAKLYAASCASCHAANLSGGAGPPLAGKPFLAKWTGQTADELHAVMSGEMPLTAPGSLKPAEYLALMAFILQKNGYPAGSAPLEKEKLKNVPLKAP